jgi:hypothetical protein
MSEGSEHGEVAQPDLWPSWCTHHPWLASFLGCVEREARTFGQQRIHILHVLVAWSHRGEAHPRWMSADAERMSAEEWLEFNIFRIGLDAGLDIGAGMPRPQRGADPLVVESDVIEKLDLAREEAARYGSSVDARHFAVALPPGEGEPGPG